MAATAATAATATAAAATTTATTAAAAGCKSRRTYFFAAAAASSSSSSADYTRASGGRRGFAQPVLRGERHGRVPRVGGDTGTHGVRGAGPEVGTAGGAGKAVHTHTTTRFRSTQGLNEVNSCFLFSSVVKGKKQLTS